MAFGDAIITLLALFSERTYFALAIHSMVNHSSNGIYFEERYLFAMRFNRLPRETDCKPRLAFETAALSS